MSSIQTGIELNDQFSGVLNNIISSVNLAVSAMYDMQQSMNADIDTSGIEGARDEINQAAEALNELDDVLKNNRVVQATVQQPETAMSDITPPMVEDGGQEPINVPVEPVLPDPLVENPEPIRPDIQPNAPPDMEPVEVPVTWNTDDIDVFTGTGIERFRQEVQSANDMLNTLNTTQARISQTAQGMDILPDAAVQDMDTMQQRLLSIQQRIKQIENNPVNIGTDRTNAELEQLRMQLNRAVREQEALNQEMQNMDVSAANEAYLHLSQIVGNTERYIRDNVDEQGRFNQEISQGVQPANELVNIIKRAVAAYVSIQSVGKVLNMSDELTQTTSRLDMMNDGIQTTSELVNMVYAAAQDARGSFGQMADVVARFGNNAKDAFGSSEEVVAFADLIQKQMTIAGASTQEAANAELQLSQALGSGVLRGDELNSIFEQAPNLIQNIADYLEVPIGQIREMASDGELSADVVKAAIFSAADDINSKFESMPMTWGQMWQSMQNTAMMAFQPVLQRLNDLANSEASQTFVNSAIEAMATLANILLNVFDLAVSIGTFIGDNWSIIAPIVYGIVAALTAYIAISAIVAAINGIMAMAEGVKAAAQMMATGATFAETAAQQGLNAALMACPLTWIIMLILALIAVIFAVCSAIAKLTGVANSGFGVITGGVNVVIQFFKNLGLTVANIALGIGNAIAALASNMMTAFHNAICSVQSWFYNLLSTACSVIESIAAALNKLPFVNFDYSGITSAANDYAAKAGEAAANKEDYKSVGDAFSEGMSTFDTFQDGWASDAFNAGAAWGDGIAEKVDNFSLSDIFGKTDIPNPDDYTTGFDDVIANAGTVDAGADVGDIEDNTGSIADDTGDISDALDITQEDLKYLRDIAEQEAINRYTTAEIKVDMSGMQNNINTDDDIDGFVNKLTESVNEAVDSMTEGVHQ
nr:MAG TPA: Tail tape measure [Caudoviricetes sp.]